MVHELIDSIVKSDFTFTDKLEIPTTMSPFK